MRDRSANCPRSASIDGHRVQITEQPLLASLVGGLLQHILQNRIEEARIFREACAVAGCEGGLQGLLRGGGDEFEPGKENAHSFCGCGLDVERKNGIDEGARNDVDEAGAFFEPGSLPGFQHGVSFVGIKTLRDEDAFQVASERIKGAAESWHRERRFVTQRAEHAMTQFFPAALKEDHVGNWFCGNIL